MNYKSRSLVDLHVIDAIDQRAFEGGASDAAMLQDLLHGEGINIVAHVARTSAELKVAIADIVAHRPSYCDPRQATPYIHISCHGTQDELLLGGGEHLPWRELSTILLPLQEKTDYHVPISISACEGFYGWKLAWGIDREYRKRRPYYSLVGPTKTERIGELCATFARFYRNLLVRYKQLKPSIDQANQGQEAKLSYTYGSILVY